MSATVSVQNLVKTYDKGKVLAVDKVSFDVKNHVQLPEIYYFLVHAVAIEIKDKQCVNCFYFILF